jgi:hypothetical protein
VIAIPSLDRFIDHSLADDDTKSTKSSGTGKDTQRKDKEKEKEPDTYVLTVSGGSTRAILQHKTTPATAAEAEGPGSGVTIDAYIWVGALAAAAGFSSSGSAHPLPAPAIPIPPTLSMTSARSARGLSRATTPVYGSFASTVGGHPSQAQLVGLNSNYSLLGSDPAASFTSTASSAAAPPLPYTTTQPPQPPSPAHSFAVLTPGRAGTGTGVGAGAGQVFTFNELDWARRRSVFVTSPTGSVSSIPISPRERMSMTTASAVAATPVDATLAVGFVRREVALWQALAIPKPELKRLVSVDGNVDVMICLKMIILAGAWVDGPSILHHRTSITGR